LAVTTEGPKIESGLAPTGVLRQMPELHNSSQFPNIRPQMVKDKRERSEARRAQVPYLLSVASVLTS